MVFSGLSIWDSINILIKKCTQCAIKDTTEFFIHSKKKSLTLTVVQYYNALPKDFIESPSMEIFKTLRN